MRQEAEAHAEEDKQLREKVETKNRCDARVYETEKLMKEHKDIITGDQKSKLDGAIEQVKAALKDDDADAMKSAEEKLTEAWHAVSSEIYAKAREKSSTAGPAAGGEAPPPPPAGEEQAKKTGKDGKVVDADFEVVDDDKKS
jgi:molecular chaperone DnaK